MKKLKSKIVSLYNKLKFKFSLWMLKLFTNRMNKHLNVIKTHLLNESGGLSKESLSSGILEEQLGFKVGDPEKAKIEATKSRGGYWKYSEELDCCGFQTVNKKDMSEGKFIVDASELSEYLDSIRKQEFTEK